MWLIWDKFSVPTSSDTETASQVQATDHEIDDEEIEFEPSAPTNDDFEEDYGYCNHISNVANEKATAGVSKRTSDLDSYPTGNLPTYDEALKIESMNKNELRRRISSQQSIKSDDFKPVQDSDSNDCPVYSPWLLALNKCFGMIADSLLACIVYVPL